MCIIVYKQVNRIYGENIGIFREKISLILRYVYFYENFIKYAQKGLENGFLCVIVELWAGRAQDI